MKIRFDLSQDYIDVANFQSICFVTSMPIAQCLPFSQETGPNGDLSGNISWSHIFCRYIRYIMSISSESILFLSQKYLMLICPVLIAFLYLKNRNFPPIIYVSKTSQIPSLSFSHFWDDFWDLERFLDMN